MLGEDRSVDSEAHVADGTGGSHWRTVSRAFLGALCVAAARTTAVMMQGSLQGVARKQPKADQQTRPPRWALDGWSCLVAAMTRIFASCWLLHHAYCMVLYYSVF